MPNRKQQIASARSTSPKAGKHPHDGVALTVNQAYSPTSGDAPTPRAWPKTLKKNISEVELNKLSSSASSTGGTSQCSDEKHLDTYNLFAGLNAILKERKIDLPRLDSAGGSGEGLPTHMPGAGEGEARPVNTDFALSPKLALLLSLLLYAYIGWRLSPEYQSRNWLKAISVTAVTAACFPALLGSMQYGVSSLLQCVLSVRPLVQNSKHYSSIPTKRDPKKPLPNVIIQIPIYLESLEEVILPTIRYAEAAIEHYRAAGGHAKIFINDDGLQIMLNKGMMDPFQARMKFYKERCDTICMVARPPEGRRGHFKKGSNMNYCLMVATGVTKLASELNVSPEQAQHAFVERFPASSAFMAAGDLTLHPDTIILLLDSDTRLSPDCITLAVPEFVSEPKLGYGQCITTAFADQRDDYFQRMIWDFTFSIYHVAIAPNVARGDIAPLVGHNAFISWNVLNDCKQENEHGVWWWSETHVSEDFDLMMRMVAKGYFGRYITYTKGFEEGISLTFPEEEKKTIKFAYGAAEMLLNPIWRWPMAGPISPLFRKFCRNPSVSIWSKLKMLLYLLEYLVIGCMPVFALTEALVVALKGPYFWSQQLGLMRSADIVLYSCCVFCVANPIGNAAIVMRAKIKPKATFFGEIWGRLKYTIPTSVQWTSYSWGFLSAYVRYLLALPMMSWGSTSKELDDNVFSDDEFHDVIVPLYGTKLLVGCGTYATWALYSWAAAIPFTEAFGLYFVSACYVVAPFLLNPNVLRLRY